jgi:hypothetical protein
MNNPFTHIDQRVPKKGRPEAPVVKSNGSNKNEDIKKNR